MNVKAMLSGRQSNDVNLDEDGFGARRLREGDVCWEMEKGHTNSRYETLILLPIWDLKDYRTSEHFIRQSQHCNGFGWLFVVTVSAATQADDESDD